MIDTVLYIQNNGVINNPNQAIIHNSGVIHDLKYVSGGNKALEYLQFIVNNFEMIDYSIPDMIVLNAKSEDFKVIEFVEKFASKFALIFPAIKILVTFDTLEPKMIAKLRSYSFIIDHFSDTLNDDSLKIINDQYFCDHVKEGLLN